MHEQVAFFWFLLMQATFFGTGLAILGVAILVLVVRRRRAVPWVAALTGLWLVPLALGGLLVEPTAGMKTADWLGGFSLFATALEFVGAVALVVVLKGHRLPGVIFSGLNTFLSLMTAFVLAMASKGTWL